MIKTLSKDAKAVAGSVFGMMKTGGGSHLTFQMIEGRPTRRMQAALDELIAAGVIRRDPSWTNAAGVGVRYEPIVDCHPYFKWVMRHEKDPDIKFPITELIEAKA
jgi:hypothetical protein